ncbi:MAG TPA: serine/threonine-protein kinase [Pirellulales bacterium]|nr:serine/threonine-protein kinase [Pirellulales bacterium]
MPSNELAIETPCRRPSLDDLLWELKREVRHALAEGRRGAAVELLSRHPRLRRCRDKAFELLYEEYQLLAAIDKDLDVAAFAGEFTWFPDQYLKKLNVDGSPSAAQLILELGSVPWPAAGDRVAGFELVDLLGKGSAARVYLAEEPALGDRLVALKVSPGKTSEAETLGKLSHPNIVPVHSVTRDGPSGLTLVCMPFLGRATLDDVCSRLFHAPELLFRAPDRLPEAAAAAVAFRSAKGLPFAFRAPDRQLEVATVDPPRRGQAILDVIDGLNEAGEEGGSAPPDPLLARRSYVDGVVHLAAQLADALAYTHSKGICHGDLKPANVLMAPGGRPMLLDFNLANAADQVDLEVGGTLAYMPPERLLAAANASKTRSDPRSDLFSLGVIVYQALCGELPFGPLPDGSHDRDMARWMWELHRTRPLPLDQRNGDVEGSLARLVERCLAYDVADRPQTARQLAAELRRHLAPRRRARRWLRVHRWLATAAAVAMIVAMSAAAHRVLNRPTPAQYAFDEGTAAYQRGDYAAANRCLTESLDYGGNTNWQIWYRRGLARQHLGDHGSALADYQAAKRLHPTREIAARIADCFCRPPAMNVASAIGAFRGAIEQGLGRAEIYNNLAVCMELMSQFDGARDCFDRSIALAPDRATPYYNRATLEWQLAFRAGRMVNQQALDDTERALALGAPSADVCTLAARLHAYRPDSDPDRRRRALDYLAQAIERGAKIERLDADPALGALMVALRTRADYANLVAAGRKRSAVATARLMDLPDDLSAADLAAR